MRCGLMSFEKMKSPKEKGELGEAKLEAVEIFVSSKASDVAKGWVRNMLGEGSGSSSDSDDSKDVELKARPPRLGLDAKFLPHSHMAAPMGPVEKKIWAMTGGAGKQQQKREGGERFGKHNAFAATPAKESKGDTESDDDEGEEVKGSSGNVHGRQQRRIGSADLFTKTSRSKGNGRKRKR